MNWQLGVPPVAPGESKDYWVAFRNHDEKTRYCLLSYLNKYVMPLHDDCIEADAEYATPIPDSDGDYLWTGWFEPYCEQCEVHWISHLKVLAWMELPRDYGEIIKVTDNPTIPARWCLRWVPVEGENLKLEAFILGMERAPYGSQPSYIYVNKVPTELGTFWEVCDLATGTYDNLAFNTLDAAKREAEVRMRSRI